MDLSWALERLRACLVAVLVLVLVVGDSGRSQARALHKRQVFQSCCFLDLFCFAMCVESSARFARHQRHSRVRRSVSVASPEVLALSSRFPDLQPLLERAVARPLVAGANMADCDASRDPQFTRLLRRLQLVAGPTPQTPLARHHPVRRHRVKRLRAVLRRLLRDFVR